MAMLRPRVGEGPPEVTTPMTFPSMSAISAPSRAGAPSLTFRPMRTREGASASSLRMRSAPLKSAASLRDLDRANVSAASTGLVVASTSWPCSGRPASRRRLSRAPRPIGFTRASDSSRFQTRSASAFGTEIS
ncbi:hypothetical protein D3C75_916090 [compost metagenome]